MARVALLGVSIALPSAWPRYFILLFGGLTTLAVVLVACERLTPLSTQIALFARTTSRIAGTIGIRRRIRAVVSHGDLHLEVVQSNDRVHRRSRAVAIASVAERIV